jgi:hypothetical protein
MRHFISFQKRKGLHIPKGLASNEGLVHQINHELMKYGYVISKDLHERLATANAETLHVVYNDLVTGISNVTGGAGHEPIYRNFPQSVLAMSYTEFLINAIVHYWSFGTWRPDDAEYINREFKLEPVDYKTIKLLEEGEFNGIFTDLLYSNTSISGFDKEVIDWFIDNKYEFNFGKIGFKETAAYVGKRLLDSDIDVLPTQDATTVLRIWSAYSGGDEGLKVNTKFKNPSSRQRKVLLNTLNNAYNLEESFKIYREKWLKFLFYLNPMSTGNSKRFNNVFNYTNLLRNNPKVLKTFNSKVEALLLEKDISVLDLLSERMGVFTRRLDHTVRLFGIVALEKWLVGNPNLMQIVIAYNHFSDRDKMQVGRGAVLASQGKSEVVTYDSLEPLDTKLVEKIKSLLIDRIDNLPKSTLSDTKVYIDRTLYYRPLGVNNRASSLSLDGKVVGTVENIPKAKVIRTYVHWEGTSDIDLSGMVIDNESRVTKVGWNGQHIFGKSIIYSGDNTGYSDKNAEYLDIVTKELPSSVEWIIVDARIYRGPKDYAGYNGKARAGWMLREHPEANEHWLPQTLEHSIVLGSDSKTAYLMAIHMPTNSLVYLDLSMGNHNITTDEDALQLRIYLDKFIMNVEDEISWDKLNQGHIINLLGGEVVDNAEDADLEFSENTTLEEVTKYLV